MGGSYEMKQFTTKNNTYYINESFKMLSGGILGEDVKKYVVAKVELNHGGYFEFTDGSVLETSTIVEIV